MKHLLMICLCLSLGLAGCTSQTQGPGPMMDTHIGGAILKEPAREAHASIYSNSGIYKTSDYGLFTQAMTVYGLTFIAKDDIPDTFLKQIGTTMESLFRQEEGIDSVQQEAVL